MGLVTASFAVADRGKNKYRKERHNIQLKLLLFNRLAAAMFFKKEILKFVILLHWQTYLLAQQHQGSESI